MPYRHYDHCADRWESERQGRDDARRDQPFGTSERRQYSEPYPCEDANRSYWDAYERETRHREEARREEREREEYEERRAHERRMDEQRAEDDAYYAAMEEAAWQTASYPPPEEPHPDETETLL